MMSKKWEANDENEDKFGIPPKLAPQPSFAPNMSGGANSLRLSHLSVIYNPTL